MPRIPALDVLRVCASVVLRGWHLYVTGLSDSEWPLVRWKILLDVKPWSKRDSIVFQLHKMSMNSSSLAHYNLKAHRHQTATSNSLTGLTRQWDENLTFKLVSQMNTICQPLMFYANGKKRLTGNVFTWIKTHIQQTKLSLISSVQLPSFHFLFMCYKTVKCTTSHWMKH